ncbi:MAG TPA: Druantia anti-phage system protein DruA [Kofleriaceae bacterium]|nr:Druantia anti-phage system protein DruA [Kofleriaceae bacterium]
MATGTNWIKLEPKLLMPRSRVAALEFARTLSGIDVNDEDRIDDALEEFLEGAPKWATKDRQRLSTLGRVLSDIARQGWTLRVRGKALSVLPPTEISADPIAEKLRVRRQEQLKRDEQLRQPAVKEFVRSMERRRLHKGRFVSIFSLMRDGREFADSLRRARAEGEEAIARVVSPYLQFVNAGERCAWTGFELQEIWRYFRHTWSNQYTSVPGRSMYILVRDAAADNHPVIGIAALSSPIVQIRERDEWIGWHPAKFLAEIQERPTERIARWLVQVVNGALSEIFVSDLYRDGILKPIKMKKPTPDALKVLVAEGVKQRALHQRYVKTQDLKSSPRKRSDNDFAHWEKRATSHLFRSKRAFALADLLAARMILDRHLSARPTKKQLIALMSDSEGLHVVKRIIRKAKAERVGIAMADISVCGAVAPYNPILGGKLVSMLVTSPEVVRAYHDRYASAESEIASSIAAKPIIRPPHLVFLGTTSLYGVGSSQYNRIKIPCEALAGRRGESIEYVRLGMSEAFGTSQYSEETSEELGLLFSHENEGQQRVNSIFGEGVSPKLRKVRDGLELLNLPAELFLKHGRKRILYGINLVRNARDFLLGLDEKPDHLIPKKAWPDASKAIAAWWRKRWLASRIQSDDVIADVARHTLVHPIVHGARVALPTDDDSQRSFSFEYHEQSTA